jgi:hypothetical protein
VLSALLTQVRIEDVTVEDPPLEEIIKHIYGMRQGGMELRSQNFDRGANPLSGIRTEEMDI